MSKKIDIDEEAESTLQEIEEDWPPDRCSLGTYRDFLKALRSHIHERIGQLNDEIGES